MFWAKNLRTFKYLRPTLTSKSFMMASSTYAPVFPSDHTVDDRFKNYIAKFYATSDDRSKNEEWVDYFLPDAVVIMGDKSAQGTEGISLTTSK